jgi:uncharacterized protein (DUF1778 family)
VSSDQKELFLRAAELQGRTLTDFVISSVHEAAVRTLEDLQSVKLAVDESRAFAEALLNPESPARDFPRPLGAIWRRSRRMSRMLASPC